MITRTARKLLWFLRVRIIRLRYRGIEIAPGVAIGGAVTIKATDGGTLVLRDHISVDKNATIIVKKGACEIGINAFIGIGSIITCRQNIIIGKNALIAEYVTIRDQDHGTSGYEPFADQPFETAPIRIGDNVWLGAKVTVLKGVTIGDNTVVGANSVVSRDLPSNIIAAGVPARIIRQRNEPGHGVDEDPPRH